jgi:hypothetical protein
MTTPVDPVTASQESEPRTEAGKAMLGNAPVSVDVVLAIEEQAATEARHGTINRDDHADCDRDVCGIAWLLNREEQWRVRVATEGTPAGRRPEPDPRQSSEYHRGWRAAMAAREQAATEARRDLDVDVLRKALVAVFGDGDNASLIVRQADAIAAEYVRRLR